MPTELEYRIFLAGKRNLPKDIPHESKPVKDYIINSAEHCNDGIIHLAEADNPCLALQNFSHDENNK